MTTRRLGAATIIVAGLMVGTACQGGGNDFEPDAEVSEDDQERHLGYTTSTALLESGNRELDTELRELSNDLKVAIDEYADLAAAAGRLVINADDPMDSGHPDQAAIDDFQEECP